MTDSNRYYFDFCDRLALRRLLPRHGERFADICGGFGRLADEYLDNFKEAVLFDYAPNLLAQAKDRYGGRLQTVQGSVYEMPFVDGEFDALMLIRAAHHLTDLNTAVGEIARILKDGGIAVIEIAHKRGIPEAVIKIAGKRSIPEVERIFQQNGLRINKAVAVSGLRRHVSPDYPLVPLLCALEYLLQYTIGWIKWSTSIFYLLEKHGVMSQRC